MDEPESTENVRQFHFAGTNVREERQRTIQRRFLERRVWAV